MQTTAPAAQATEATAVPETITATPQELAETFELWESAYRDDPASFLTEEECLACGLADISTERAIYFTALLRKVKQQGGAA